MSTTPAPDVDELVRLDFEVDPVLTLAELGKGPRDPGEGNAARSGRENWCPGSPRHCLPVDARLVAR